MNSFVTLLADYAPWIAGGLRVFAIIQALMFILPLQIREAKVKNGLRLLRYQLLLFGLILLLINVSSLYFLFHNTNLLSCYFSCDESISPALFQVVTGLAFFSLSMLGFHMYHTQYTDEAKQIHEQIHELETTQKQ